MDPNLVWTAGVWGGGQRNPGTGCAQTCTALLFTAEYSRLDCLGRPLVPPLARSAAVMQYAWPVRVVRLVLRDTRFVRTSVYSSGIPMCTVKFVEIFTSWRMMRHNTALFAPTSALCCYERSPHILKMCCLAKSTLYGQENDFTSSLNRPPNWVHHRFLVLTSCLFLVPLACVVRLNVSIDRQSYVGICHLSKKK